MRKELRNIIRSILPKNIKINIRKMPKKKWNSFLLSSKLKLPLFMQYLLISILLLKNI
jgi:hypothetical protein